MATQKIAGKGRVRDYPPVQRTNVDEINRKETPAGAQAKADAVWDQARDYTDAEVAAARVYIDERVAEIVAVEGWTFADPLVWNSTTEYPPRQVVDYQGAYYVSTAATQGDQPDLGLPWSAIPTAVDADHRGDQALGANGPHSTQFAAYFRRPVAGDAVLYVAAGGSDANDGLAWGSAFASIQAAHDALPAAGGRIEVGGGTFAGFTWTKSDVHIIGRGRDITTIAAAAGDIVTLSTTAAITDCVISDLTIHSQAGGGHAVVVPTGFSMSLVENVNIRQSNDAKSVWHCVRSAATGGMFNTVFRGGHWTHTATATVPGVYIVGAPGSSGNVCSDCRWESLRVQNSGDYFFHIEANVAAVWNYNNSFVNVEAEVMESGLIRLLSAAGTTIDNVWSHDNSALTKSLFYLQQSANGPQNRATIFRNCGRPQGTLGAGAHDIELAGTNDSIGTHIHEYTGPSAGGGSINLGANEFVGLIGYFPNVTVTGFPNDRGFMLDLTNGARFHELSIAGGAALTSMLQGSRTYDPPSIAAGAVHEFTITVTGAVTGSHVHVTPNSLGTVPAGLSFFGVVSAADTVTVRLTNNTAAAIDPPNAIWRTAVLALT